MVDASEVGKDTSDVTATRAGDIDELTNTRGTSFKHFDPMFGFCCC